MLEVCFNCEKYFKIANEYYYYYTLLIKIIV